MLTPWGEALDKNAVLQEYPRPQLVRESYYNLNGLWDYAITPPTPAPARGTGRSSCRFRRKRRCPGWAEF